MASYQWKRIGINTAKAPETWLRQPTWIGNENKKTEEEEEEEEEKEEEKYEKKKKKRGGLGGE
jgi:Zn-finger nucleic acid-binding protein